FGIAHLAGVPGRYLSAGQKRRLNLARLEASPAPLWLLDEPTAGLDAEAVAGLRNAIARQRWGGGMVVLSTHAEMALDGAEVLDLGDFSAATRMTPAAEETP
ncbi:MAG: ATP-binding cassette domain-containing protein, partial [Rhodospirillales bacterium]